MAPPAEIFIPSTTVSSGSKQHTLYTITLRLPLRSFVVQKRYSEFVDLHHELLTATGGSPPPRPLPPKLWVKNTVSNDEAREERRAGLEAYLRAINESPDRRWRDTPAWRSFLNLPAGTTGSVSNSAASARGLSSNMNVTNVGKPAAATGATDPTTWLDLHREMKNALHEARLHLSKRDDALPGSTAVFEAGTAAKRALVKAGSLLASLTEGLKVIQSEGKGRLGEGELRRRRDLLAVARNERDGLDKLAVSLSHATRHSNASMPALGAAGGTDRKELLGNATQTVKTGRRAIGGPLPETERTRELDNVGVVQLQRDMMAEQDASVSDLAKIIRRQRELGLAIFQEIEEQTAMLDQVDNDVTRLEGKTRVVEHRTRTLGM